jgi:hypothetical protein
MELETNCSPHGYFGTARVLPILLVGGLVKKQNTTVELTI